MSIHEASPLLHETGNGGSGDAIHHHHTSSVRQLYEDVPYYSRPRQLQRWDDTQVLPHVNWGDLYWDLFYVSGAYNLAAALKESLTPWGLFYFASCYLCIINIWLEKTSYDARYTPEDNLFHRAIEIVHILVLGIVIQHIRPLSAMQNTTGDMTTFIFCLGLLVESVIALYRQIDVYRNVDGGPEAKHNASADIRRKIAGLVLFATAAVIAITDYSTPSRRASSAEPQEVSDVAVPLTGHIPMILCFLSYFGSNMMSLIERFCITANKTGSHKDYNVPLNVEFCIHRLGEWVMLMLGESVLALLIVEQSEGMRYYASFFSGILSVTMFQYLYFRSQPFQASDHAMRRSSAGGYMFGYSLTVYSASLILYGCSYKMILHYFLEEEELAEEYGEAELTNNEMLQQELQHIRQQISRLFGWSMALSFVTLDLMIISHRGWKAFFSRFCVNGTWQMAPLGILMINYALLAANVMLSGWFDRLELVSSAGLVIVLAQLLLRTRGLRYFPVSKKAMELATHGQAGTSGSHRVWPNRTQPRSVASAVE